MKEERLIDRLERGARPLSLWVFLASVGGGSPSVAIGIIEGNKEQLISGATALLCSTLALAIAHNAHNFFRKPSQEVSSLKQEKEQEPTVIEVISGVFINEDNQILLVRRTPKRTYNPSTYDLIGGDILPRETPIQTLKRDAKGKLGIDLDKENIEEKGTKDIDAPNAIIRRHMFVCRISVSTPIELDSKKYDGWGWYDASQVEQLNLSPGVKDILIAIGFLIK